MAVPVRARTSWVVDYSESAGFFTVKVACVSRGERTALCDPEEGKRDSDDLEGHCSRCLVLGVQANFS